MVNFEQASREINVNGYAIAKEIRLQSTAGSETATNIINVYEGAVKGAGDAQKMAESAFLNLYNAWRDENADLVSEIAAGLGHPLPGNTPSENAFEAAGVATGAFDGVAPVPAPADVPLAPQAALIIEGTVPGPLPVPRGRGSRKAWTQAEIVKLTLTVATAQDKVAALVALTADLNNNRTVDDIEAKAIELGLLAGPVVPPQAIDLTDAEKKTARTKLLTLGDIKDAGKKLAFFKYIATEAKEIAKELAG